MKRMLNYCLRMENTLIVVYHLSKVQNRWLLEIKSIQIEKIDSLLNFVLSIPCIDNLNWDCINFGTIKSSMNSIMSWLSVLLLMYCYLYLKKNTLLNRQPLQLLTYWNMFSVACSCETTCNVVISHEPFSAISYVKQESVDDLWDLFVRWLSHSAASCSRFYLCWNTSSMSLRWLAFSSKDASRVERCLKIVDSRLRHYNCRVAHSL